MVVVADRRAAAGSGDLVGEVSGLGQRELRDELPEAMLGRGQRLGEGYGRRILLPWRFRPVVQLAPITAPVQAIIDDALSLARCDPFEASAPRDQCFER